MRQNFDAIETTICKIHDFVVNSEEKCKIVAEAGIESVSLSDSDPETVKANGEIQRSLLNIRENLENLNGIAEKLKEILYYDVCPQPPDLNKKTSK